MRENADQNNSEYRHFSRNYKKEEKFEKQVRQRCFFN